MTHTAQHFFFFLKLKRKTSFFGKAFFPKERFVLKEKYER